MISRKDWGAAPPRSAMTRMGTVTRQCVHHSAGVQLSAKATKAQEIEVVRSIQRQHFARGMSDIAYHRLIAPSGRIYQGRDPDYMGAGVFGANEGTIHICILGNYEVTQNKPTKAAIEAAAKALRNLPGARRRLYGHFQLGPSACPGKNLKARLADINRLRRS